MKGGSSEFETRDGASENSQAGDVTCPTRHNDGGFRGMVEIVTGPATKPVGLKTTQQQCQGWSSRNSSQERNGREIK